MSDVLTTVSAQRNDAAAAMVQRIQGGYIPQDIRTSGMPEGFDFRDHQKASVAFAALTPKCLILDEMGLGKTLTGAGLLKYLDDRGRLHPHPGSRAIVVTTAPNVIPSWQMDGFGKFYPDMPVGVARGTKKQRLAVYNDPSWKVLLVGYETLRNDVDWLTQLDFQYAILDEVDVLGNPNSKVTTAVRQVVRNCERRVGMTGTFLTDRTLMKAHSILEVLGIDKAFAPSRTHFSNYFHVWETKEQWTKSFNKRTRRVEAKKIWIKEFKSLQNANEFREKLRPYYLRRKREDVNIKVPELRSIVKYLEPTSEQERLYKQAKQGFLKIESSGDPRELERAWDYLKAICINSKLVGGKESSAKMDFLEEKLKGEWKNEKLVVFVNNLEAVDIMCKRLEKLKLDDDTTGVGYVKYIGSTTDKARAEGLTRFREDPDCKVFIGTRTLVRGLNLQVARIQVNLELLPNPGEVAQVAGRVARDGSLHDECLVVTLLVINTFEYAWYKYVSQKQAVSDFILEDSSEIFEKLTPKEMFSFIKS